MTRTRIEHVLGSPGVGAQRSERVVDDVTHADRRREMEDLVGRLDLLVDEVGIEDRSLDEPSPAVEVRGAARHQAVEHRHLCALVAERTTCDPMKPAPPVTSTRTTVRVGHPPCSSWTTGGRHYRAASCLTASACCASSRG
jgi:hypothetical protein